MTFASAEQFLLSLTNLPRREYMKDKKRCEIYLKRTQYLLDLLGNPEKKISHYIHVTGTSGKGSVATFLHAILEAAGLRAGLLTSPHHTKITERWQVGNRQMSAREFVALVAEIKPVLDQYIRESPYDFVSYHELMDVIGFVYFARHKVAWAVLEVGMGGRYDSTNVIPWKDAAVITNIGWDHRALIGPTKSAIAHEKAGIIKPRGLVFTGEKNKKMLAIIKNECKKNKARLKISNFEPASPRLVGGRAAGGFQILNYDLDGSAFEYDGRRYQIQTPGRHQVENAVLCIDVARALKIPEAAIKKGLARAQQPLRMEVVAHNPLIILDGAHNVEKMKTTVDTLKHSRPHLIIGFSHDKLWPQMIEQLAKLKPVTIACTRNTVNPFRKVAPPQAIASDGRKLLPQIKIESFLDPISALAWSRRQCQKDDILLITGSIFLSGELRPYLTKRS